MSARRRRRAAGAAVGLAALVPHAGCDPAQVVLGPGSGDADGYTVSEGDCDDTDAAVHPGAPEVCDGRDQDCDGEVDDGLLPVGVYVDADGDGHGDPARPVDTCDALAYSHSAAADDCDDADPTVHPGAAEACGDVVDEDCDGHSLACAPRGEISLADAHARLVGEGSGHRASLVFGPGDLDGDGYADLLIAASGYSDGGSGVGAVYVVPGPVLATDRLEVAGIRLVSDPETDSSHLSIGSTGDLGRDGALDVVVGVSVVPGDPEAGGGVLVFHGPFTEDRWFSDADLVLVGEDSDDRAGWSVAGVGDADGDGGADVVVGAPHARDQFGVAYLLLSPLTHAASLGASGAKLVGESSYAHAGHVVSGVGDVDGDGYDDLLVGAPDQEYDGGAPGVAYLVRGRGSFLPEHPLAEADARLIGEDDADSAGSTLAAAGDVDGDGLADFLVGARLHDADAGAIDAGAVYLFLGMPSGDVFLADADARIAGDARQQFVGHGLAGAGDIDGDGYDDVLVGAHGAGDGQEGRTYLFFGPLQGSLSVSDAGATFAGEAVFDHAGQSVSGAGDVDGDGFQDLLIGAFTDKGAETECGSTYLVRGGPPGR